MKFGIVTGANASFFEGVQALVCSVCEDDIPIHCYDYGLTDANRHWLDDAGVTHAPMIASDSGAMMRTKPRCIMDAPFERVLWMDADTLVIRPLDDLRSQLDEHFVVTRFWNQRPRQQRLYELLPPARAEVWPWINAGVMAFDLQRDAKLLNVYSETVKKIEASPELSAACLWHDEGAMNWSLRDTGLGRLITMNERWNTSVRVHHRRRFHVDDEDIMDRLRTTYPTASILHWNGRLKLWNTRGKK